MEESPLQLVKVLKITNCKALGQLVSLFETHLVITCKEKYKIALIQYKVILVLEEL